MSRFGNLFGDGKAIIGMIHLPPLPDYPASPGLERIVEQALADLEIYESAGVAGVLIENEYDRPHRVRAAAETISAMTEITAAVVNASRSTVVGCEILLNDPQASFDVAREGGASFIRSDYFVDRMRRAEYGEFEIDPEGLLRYRAESGADDVLLLADVQVKYAEMIESRPLAASAVEACRKRADGVVVTGTESGSAPTAGELRSAVEGIRQAGSDVPVLIGSGLNAGNAAELLACCNGAIVGTALMRNRRLNATAVSELMDVVARCVQ